MSRARNIKPGFFENETLAECDPLARILFAALWCQADRAGRLEDRPTRLKAKCLPYDHCNVDALLAQLAEREFILRYEVDGKKYIQVIEFLKHQNPHSREKPSSIPAHVVPKHNQGDAEAQPRQVQGQEIKSFSPADSLIPDSLIPEKVKSLVSAGEDGDCLPDEEEGGCLPPTGPKAPEKRGTRLPDNWLPDAGLVSWARTDCPTINLMEETAKFKDYWKSKTGKDATKLDWPATFRNWLRNAKKYASGTNGARHSRSAVEEKNDREGRAWADDLEPSHEPLILQGEFNVV